VIPDPLRLAGRSGTLGVMADSTRKQFRALLKPGAALILPGVANALAARVVADCGFGAAYVTGAGIANTSLGIPDNGLVTVTELVQHVVAIRDVFPGPLMVDADTGFGNALNMRRTIQMLERAGADAIQIEDQVFPKRCGHFEGKEVIPAAEMTAKIKAAVDARTDPDLLIVARTDAIAVEGFAAAMDRAEAFREAGADVGFVEAPTNNEQIAAIGKLPWPQLVNIVIGGKTPERANEELKQLGFAGVLYANTALQAAVLGMQRALSHLKANGRIGDATGLLATFAERQRLVDIQAFQDMERKYK
jgi:2-methylisocitrate lyase-like PEP mutase family enzyme